MRRYNLGFVSDEDIFNHVQTTVEKYRFSINLSQFQDNIIDPIKLTFDSKVYRKTIETIIGEEISRQIDKSNNNHIGYFHQNLFGLIGKGWSVPSTGYDIENKKKHIFVEMKNKHNTMNSSSAKNTLMRMQNTCLQDEMAVCYLAEVISIKHQDIPWRVKLDGKIIENNRIRKISIDLFYKLVTGDALAFKKLCAALPTILDDVVAEMPMDHFQNTVLKDLKKINPDILKSLYSLSFKTYEGFDDFSF